MKAPRNTRSAHLPLSLSFRTKFCMYCLFVTCSILLPTTSLSIGPHQYFFPRAVALQYQYCTHANIKQSVQLLVFILYIF